MSKKRLHDTEIWDEDWFVDLPDQYKLFWLFIKDNCDHAGVWRVNRRKFSNSVPGKLVMLDDFLNQVNSKGEKPKERVVVLDNGRWWLPGFINFQCGGRFVIEVGAHRGMLKLLVNNDIPLEKVPRIDFGFLKTLDKQQLSEIVHAKSMLTVYYLYAKGMERRIEREIEQEGEKKGGVGENNDITLADPPTLAAKSFTEISNYFPTVKEADFNTWKAFVKEIESHNMQQIYTAQFISPKNWSALYHVSGFKEDKWLPVLKKLFSTGIKPEHNLFYRIPEFMGYIKSGTGPSAGENNLATNNDGNFENQDKW